MKINKQELAKLAYKYYKIPVNISEGLRAKVCLNKWNWDSKLMWQIEEVEDQYTGNIDTICRIWKNGVKKAFFRYPNRNQSIIVCALKYNPRFSISMIPWEKEDED